MNLSTLISALIAVESGGRDLAIGDFGAAIGPLQIHQSVVFDVNRISRTHFTHQEMTNRAIAVQVARVYLNHYAKGRTDEEAARIWNGGPLGYKKSATIPYWKKVKNQMNKLRQTKEVKL